MAKLIHREKRQERQLLKPVTLIGRAEYCDVCVRNPTVSREHARIVKKLTGYYIEDLGSTHGTRVNGVRIHGRTKLLDGDVIAVGAIREPGHETTVPSGPHTDTVLQPEPGGLPRGPGPGQPLAGATFTFRK